MKMQAVYNTIINDLTKLFNRITPYNKFIIGLSGGLDSAVVAALCTFAVGKENVITYNLPSATNSEKTKQLAEQIAGRLDIKYHVKPIESMYQALVSHMEMSDVDKGNLQARIRGLMLQTFASAKKGVCISCSNKTERMTGYFTYTSADDTGAIAPIGDLYKTEVFQLGEFINKYHGEELIPTELLLVDGKVEIYPSAELIGAGNDPFDFWIDDVLIEMLLHDNERAISIHKKYKSDPLLKAFVDKVYKDSDTFFERLVELEKMINSSEWKRDQCPPIIRVNKREE